VQSIDFGSLVAFGKVARQATKWVFKKPKKPKFWTSTLVF
jgi:hypothetical protein